MFVSIIHGTIWTKYLLKYHCHHYHYYYHYYKNSNNKQLLDEVEHDSENYQGRGLCYLPKPKAEADNTNRVLDNFAIMRKPNPLIVYYTIINIEALRHFTEQQQSKPCNDNLAQTAG